MVVAPPTGCGQGELWVHGSEAEASRLSPSSPPPGEDGLISLFNDSQESSVTTDGKEIPGTLHSECGWCIYRQCQCWSHRVFCTVSHHLIFVCTVNLFLLYCLWHNNKLVIESNKLCTLCLKDIAQTQCTQFICFTKHYETNSVRRTQTIT